MSEIRYRPMADNDLMQILDGEEIGPLGVRLSPDTADLFAAAPNMVGVLLGLCNEFEASIAEAENGAAGRPGMQVPFHGAFSAAIRFPSTVEAMRWWVCEMRRAIPRGCADADLAACDAAEEE